MPELYCQTYFVLHSYEPSFMCIQAICMNGCLILKDIAKIASQLFIFQIKIVHKIRLHCLHMSHQTIFCFLDIPS